MLVVTMTDHRRTVTRTLPGDVGEPDAFAGIGPEWPDDTTPRTDRPVRFHRFGYTMERCGVCGCCGRASCYGCNYPLT